MNFGTTAKQVLAAVAPLLGGAIGGPFGAAAGVILQKALGTSDPKAIEAGITSGDPDILVKLKQADNDFRVQMESLGVQEEQIASEDRASARQREEVVKDLTPQVLAYGITAGFFLVLGWLVKNGLPANNNEVLLVLMGSLGTAWTGIVSYYFGSSAGSVKKDVTIASIAKKP